MNIELAWAAGFFDGEGSVTFSRGGSKGARSTKATLVLNLSQIDDRGIVERFAAAVGLGSVRGPYSYRGEPRKFQWSVTGQKAHAVMAALWPFLSDKKRARYLELKDEVV